MCLAFLCLFYWRLTIVAYRRAVNSFAQLYDWWISGLSICHCRTDLWKERNVETSLDLSPVLF